jgi:hypothetical protein
MFLHKNNHFGTISVSFWEKKSLLFKNLQNSALSPGLSFAVKMDASFSSPERTTEENFASLPSPVSLPEVSPTFSDLPDEVQMLVKKRARSFKRTLHIENTCPTSAMTRSMIFERRNALDREKAMMERQCEASPGPLAVTVRVTRADIGRRVIVRGYDNRHMYGELESCNKRTIYPSDGTPSWEARIFTVRNDGDDESGRTIPNCLYGVHHIRIVSMPT